MADVHEVIEPNYDGQDIDLTVLDEIALDDLAHRIETERRRRHSLASAESRVASIARDYLTARDGTLDPDNPRAWVRPTAAHDAYPDGWAATHDGKVWDSTRDGEDQEPGSPHSLWVQRTAEGEDHPVWTPDTRYHTGDLRYWPDQDGPLYRCTRDHYGQLPPDDPQMHSVWVREDPTTT